MNVTDITKRPEYVLQNPTTQQAAQAAAATLRNAAALMAGSMDVEQLHQHATWYDEQAESIGAARTARNIRKQGDAPYLV